MNVQGGDFPSATRDYPWLGNICPMTSERRSFATVDACPMLNTALKPSLDVTIAPYLTCSWRSVFHPGVGGTQLWLSESRLCCTALPYLPMGFGFFV